MPGPVRDASPGRLPARVTVPVDRIEHAICEVRLAAIALREGRTADAESAVRCVAEILGPVPAELRRKGSRRLLTLARGIQDAPEPPPNAPGGGARLRVIR